MKANEIRNMSVAELENKLVDLKKDLFMLRMQHATNHLDNPTSRTEEVDNHGRKKKYFP